MVDSSLVHPTNPDLSSILYHEATILARLDEVASEISEEYASKNLTIIAILHGGIIFLADLLRRIHLPVRIETINVSSYHGGTESSGTITFNQAELPDLKGQHVLLLDDILDTGRTLDAIGRRVLEECEPESVKVCVLLDKKRERAAEVEPDFVAFEIEDEFVVGYGLDYDGHYRNLPYIGILSPAVYDENSSVS